MTTTKLVVSRAEFEMVQTHDDCPDLSFLGKYSDTPAEHHIDRKERGDMGRNEFRYFNAGCGDPEYIEQDYRRMEAYNAGEWHMIGIYARVELNINGTIQTIRSGGLYGIESDSGVDYLTEIYQEQCAELVEILESMGIEVRD